jgi:hypothetical protein
MSLSGADPVGRRRHSEAAQAARREQRERLFAAIVAGCEEKGFDANSVEDLLRISGVSRATFYEQFDDKLDIYGAGPVAIASRDEIGRNIVGALVGPALEAGINAPDLVIEASAGAVYGVLFEGIWKGKTADLPRLAPYLTYLALAPFIGAEEACDVATSRGRTG